MKVSSRPIQITSIIVTLIIASLACNAPESSPTKDLASIVAQTQTAIAVHQILATTTSTQVATPGLLPTYSSPATMITSFPTNPSSTSSTTAPTAIPDCTDIAKFEGETIPDKTTFMPGQEFIKTWTLRNVGSCVWNTEYSLVSVEGNPMGGTSPSPIGRTVPPNGTIQIYLPQKAPMLPGEHQGFWKLRGSSGKEFGLGSKADVAFWVKIIVTPETSASNNAGITPQNLGAPTWSESFNSKKTAWYLGADTDINFDIHDGLLVMTAFQPIGDQWRVASAKYLDNFYLQSKYKTGSPCSGKDGYGLIVRAPEKKSGNINSGYVFSFSCDGQFRIYRMDNGNFNSIANWKLNPAIRAGKNQENVMGVSARDGNFQLSSNGTLVYEFTDFTYTGGLFGLVIRSDLTNNFQVSVDEAAYWLYK